MREFDLDFFYTPDARRTYEGLNSFMQEDVDRRIDYLCRRPEPDEEFTFAWPEEGPNVFIFYDGAWVITYALANDALVLEIWSIAPAALL